VTDPNGVDATTAHDELDRVTSITHQGATDPEDLVTENKYNEFGDLPDSAAEGSLLGL